MPLSTLVNSVAAGVFLYAIASAKLGSREVTQKERERKREGCNSNRIIIINRENGREQRGS